MRASRLVMTVVMVAAATGSRAGERDGAREVRPAAWPTKVDPWVIATGAAGPTDFLVYLTEQADLGGADLLTTKAARGRFVFDQLTETARRTQGPLLELLSRRGIEHQPFWVANMIRVRGDLGLAVELARRDDVARIHANPTVALDLPAVEETMRAPGAIEPGLTRVRAPEVWAGGFFGQEVVVGGQDTGYDWDHPALIAKYRGSGGKNPDHDYNWHDSIHGCFPGSPPPCGGSCGVNAAAPCDDQGHGTHTMGTMVGDDGAANQVGMAPGAKWIGCRNMDRGNGTPATYSECFQWFIAPTDSNGENPDPSRSPDVINNSWGCPPSEGCTDPNALLQVVNNTRAAGILVVVSAGNSGSGCGTVVDPPAIYQSSFSVGATSAANDAIAGFSSRGPVTIDGSNRLKPNVSAPGVSVRSSVPGTGYASMSGTSMAGPHVVGAAALLMSLDPTLVGDVAALESTLQATAVHLTSTQTCGGVPGSQSPNNTFGHGRIDVFEAGRSRSADLGLATTAWPRRIRVGKQLRHVVTVSNAGPLGVSAAEVVVELPASFGSISATPSQGACVLTGTIVDCALGALAVSAVATIEVVAMPGQAGTAQAQHGVSSERPDLVSSNNQAVLTTNVARCSPGINCP